MRGLPLIAAVFLAFVAVSVIAQQPQGFEKGFAPEKLYHFWDIDSVNSFNGNLSLTLPIGPAYPVNAGLSYQLTLTYNSKVWDYEQIAGYNRAVPSRRSNAGMGWLLSMGRMIPPYTPTGGGSWIYESPDGRDHVTFTKLHDDDPATSFSAPITSVGYTRDGSYLRMLQYSTGPIHLEFPDGTIKTFDPSNGNLQSINDRSGNSVSISYLTSTSNTPCPLADTSAWQITDSQNARTNYACFTSRNGYPESTYPGQVDRVILAAPQDTSGHAQSATYLFGYSATTPIDRGCHSQYPNDSPTVTIPLLSSVTLPNSSTFSFAYNQHQANGACEQGTMSGVTLPTGGQIAYGYRFYQIPTDTCSTGTWDSFITGVGTRTVSGPRIPTSHWTYTSNENLTPAFVYCQDNFNRLILKRAPSEEMIVTVTDPLGNVTEHYYSVWPIPSSETLYDSSGSILRDGNGSPISTSPNGFNMPEYGLSFTRMPSTADSGKLLSERVYTAAGYVASPKQPLRSFHLTYERDSTTCTIFDFNCLTSNARVNSQRVIYHDDGSAASTTDSSNFDGLGHYRTATLGGSFAGGSAITTTAYNKRDADVNPSSGLNSGSYPGSFTLPSGTDAWLLDFPSSVQHTEAATTSVIQACYDGVTGFRRARRILKRSSRDPGDLLAVFTSVGGNIASESYYGGDVRNNAPVNSTLCAVADSPPPAYDYQISHIYAFGLRARSQYAGVSFLSLNRTIDQYTGVTLRETDPAGISTSYNYDAQFRLSSISPPASALTTYTYVNAAGSGSAFTPARVEEKTVSAQGAGTLETHYQYDAGGRLWREKKRMPDDSFSVRETLYNSAGSLDWISELEKLVPSPTEYDFVPAHKTSYSNYDPFGRPGSVTAADGKVSTAQYFGVRSVLRTVSVATGVSESNVSTRQTFDRQGRLLAITEADGAPNAITTNYRYDVGGRLASVSASGQNRSFTYDDRGFLLNEQHPENGQTSYGAYDARGHLGSKTVNSANSHFDLTYDYDPAERLRRVYSRDPNSPTSFRLSKEYTYGTSTASTNLNSGKLDTAKRYNYDSPNPTPVIITEIYTYNGYIDPAGRLTEKTTTIEGLGPSSRTVYQDYAYNDLGLLSRITYPRPDSYGTPTWSDIQPQYTSGRLTTIQATGITQGTPAQPDFTSTNITYWPNGMVNLVPHNNGVTDTYSVDTTNGIPRPSRIQFQGWTACTPPGIISQSGNDPPIYYGDQKNLFVTAAGDSPTYQWYQGQTPITGATAASYTATPTQTTTYWVRVTNSCGHVDSAVIAVSVKLRAPVSLVADRSGANSINIAWQASTGATSYQLYRESGGVWSLVGTPSTTSFADIGVASNLTFVYQVRAAGTNVITSDASNNDIESTLSFTSVTAGRTISVSHFNELLNGVNSVRWASGQTAQTWSQVLSNSGCPGYRPNTADPGNDPANRVVVYGWHILSLRCAMDSALKAAGVPRSAYTDAALTNVVIKAIHVTELQLRTDYLGDGR